MTPTFWFVSHCPETFHFKQEPIGRNQISSQCGIKITVYDAVSVDKSTLPERTYQWLPSLPGAHLRALRSIALSLSQDRFQKRWVGSIPYHQGCACWCPHHSPLQSRSRRSSPKSESSPPEEPANMSSWQKDPHNSVFYLQIPRTILHVSKLLVPSHMLHSIHWNPLRVQTCSSTLHWP